MCPDPNDGNTDVGSNTDLSWIRGDYARSHDVYFSTNFADVNGAARHLCDLDGSGWVDIGDVGVMSDQWLSDGGMADFDDSCNVDFGDFAVLVGQLGQGGIGGSVFMGNQPADNNSYEPGELDLLQTYYWRIDEINVAHSNSPWRGDVWEFMTSDAPPGQEFQFTPIDDSYVKSDNTSGNWGGDDVMKVRGAASHTFYSYLKFTVSGVNGTVTSAKLRLRCKLATSNLSVWPVTGSWDESTITWVNDSLVWGGSALDTLSSMAVETWYELDVTSAVTGNGTYTFGLKTTDSDARSWYTKESAYDPQLLVETNGGL